MAWAIWILGAYLVGSVPFGYLIGRMRGVDVRTVGSKNIGATNVYRTVGKGWGLLAFLCDFLKGLLPTLAALRWSGDANLPVLVGLACVVGHTLTVFMRFRGGKGVATAFGMMIALAPLPTLAAFGVFVVTVWLSHYISLGSMLAAVTLGSVVWLVPASPLLRGVATAIAVFVVVKHRSNIVRLAKGCENKIY
ncbi:MAG: glycerol-3-phosphate 1-O-acyltransferase PlsY [Kiritimatiellae bacterium]|nr:glycerol-3-phosphate 1-O-acyltransferase PlsY [Kiritimatiellia bacterium]